MLTCRPLSPYLTYRNRLNQYDKKMDSLNHVCMLREKHVSKLKHISELSKKEMVADEELANWLTTS